MNSNLMVVSPNSLTQKLVQFSDARHKRAHGRFLEEMLIGILGSQSTVLANIARFIGGNELLASTENRLSRMLHSKSIEWDDLRLRTLEINSRFVGKDDVIAFDPGDLSKDYAVKMENIYRVHDGSKNECSNGFEDFSVEAIQWKDGKKFHVPLYEKLIAASCEDYISQNRQIIDAIRTVHDYLGDRGIWTFDRGHDRSRIIEKALLPLPIRWILRAKENRSIVPAKTEFLPPGAQCMGLMDLVKKMPLSTESLRLLAPKKSGYLHLAWTEVTLFNDDEKRALHLLVVKDERNEKPIVILTNLPIKDESQALVAFGYYLERWGKEEGYRFIKSFLNLENIRTLKWENTQNLSFLTFLTYVFITGVLSTVGYDFRSFF
jgi:hypothetical protein